MGWDKRIVEAYWIKGAISANGEIITKGKAHWRLHSCSSEKLVVFYLEGSAPFNHDGSTRSEFLPFAPIRQNAGESGDHHAWEKPLDLAKFLVNKFTDAGQNVFEPFGCSGAFSRAAALLGRHFIYSESNEENYRWGSANKSGSVCFRQTGGLILGSAGVVISGRIRKWQQKSLGTKNYRKQYGKPSSVASHISHSSIHPGNYFGKSL